MMDKTFRRSVESLIDPDSQIKTLIENKYLGQVSQWQLSYFYSSPDCRKSVSDELCLNLPLSAANRRKQVKYDELKRAGSMTDRKNNDSPMRKSFWLRNVKLEKHYKAKQESPLKRCVLNAAFQLNTHHKEIYAKGKQIRQSDEPSRQPFEQDGIIGYYKSKYEKNGSLSRSQRLLAHKRKNLPRLELPKPLQPNSRIDPW